MSTADRDLAVAAFAAATGRHICASSPVTRLGPQWEAFWQTFDAAAYRESLEEQGVSFISLFDEGFPHRLAGIRDVPVGLFTRGGPEMRGPRIVARPVVGPLDGPRVVGIVGARACSAYGGGVARSLARELAGEGCVIVAGLARGIDAEAHRGALDAAGTTVAVLGCGIDRHYPASHAELDRRIVESGGLIVSEYAPGVEPAPWRFPARNRIIAGLVDVLVVVEARFRSGALITADVAMEERRPVFAVPGEITSALSEGTNELLWHGAKVCRGAADVLAEVERAAAARAAELAWRDGPQGRRVVSNAKRAAAGADAS